MNTEIKKNDSVKLVSSILPNYIKLNEWMNLFLWIDVVWHKLCDVYNFELKRKFFRFVELFLITGWSSKLPLALIFFSPFSIMEDFFSPLSISIFSLLQYFLVKNVQSLNFKHTSYELEIASSSNIYKYFRSIIKILQ